MLNRDGQITRAVGSFPTVSTNFNAVLVVDTSVSGANYAWCASTVTLVNSGVSRTNRIPHICQPAAFNIPFEASARIIRSGQSGDLQVKG